VREVDALAARVTVYHWSDEHATSEGAGPNSIPTPYNRDPSAAARAASRSGQLLCRLRSAEVRARALVFALALVTLWPLRAEAKPVAEIDGGAVLFYSDSLGIVVRNGVTLHLAGGMVVSGDTAYIDLRADKAIVAGSAQITRGAVTLHADALAFDLPGRKLDVLRSDTGIARADATLTQLQPAPDDGDAFAFPISSIGARTSGPGMHRSSHARASGFGPRPSHVGRRAAGTDVSLHVCVR